MTGTLVLRDEQNRTLTCEILKQLEFEGQTYALLTPVDECIEILVWGEDDEVTLDADDFQKGLTAEDYEGMLFEPDPDELLEALPTARAVLSEQNLHLELTAFDLMTVKGEVPEVDEDDIVEIAKEEDVEEYQILSTFYHEEDQYAVLRPLDPLLFFAVEVPGQEARLLLPEDNSELFYQLQSLIAADEGEDEA
ncbi:MAG: DUF3727 domain-containing protein [Synechococcaceae cyanobacterium SM2_3_2]|nr:DUF3727 domain-containing protein [Synechococcaceae cyanobacterium SM2_3_2]